MTVTGRESATPAGSDRASQEVKAAMEMHWHLDSDENSVHQVCTIYNNNEIYTWEMQQVCIIYV